MFEVVQSLHTLSLLLPPDIPAVVPEISTFAHSVPLAAQFGTVALIAEDAQKLRGDASTASSILPEITAEFSQIRAVLTGIAENMITEAQALLPQLLSTEPATQLGAQTQMKLLPDKFMEQAMVELEESEQRLSPATNKLTELAASSPPAQNTDAYTSPDSLSTLPASAAPDSDNSAGQRAVAAAKTQLGTPYVWGGTSTDGFDCSGFTQWSWRQAGVEIPRLAEHQNIGQQVSATDLIEGDLLVWDGHVAMYAGDGQIIEAGNPVQMNPVRTTNLDMDFKGYFRPPR